MSVLVTGATGFVGAALARALAGEGATLRLLCRPSSDRRNLAGLDAEIVEGDLRERAWLARAVRGCEAVFHCAADYRLWVPDPDAMYQSNVTGTLMLLEAAAEAGVPRMVYTSSVSTLGIPPGGGEGDESTPVRFDDMIGHYKRSKFLAEAAVRRKVREQGWPVVIVNPSTPIGPRDVKPTPTGRILVDAATGKMPAYVDTGLNVVHVDDVASGHLLALEHGEPGERYVLAGENMALKTIIDLVARLRNRAPTRVRLPHMAVLPVAVVSEWVARLSGSEPLVSVDGVRMSMKHMYFSSAKARARLGYQSRPAGDAITDAIAWFDSEGYLA